MSDDIVTRLRAYNIGNIGHEASSHMEETLYESADEIERLRAEVKRWRGWATDYAYDDPTCECERCDAVMQAYTGCTCRSKPNACPEHHDPTRD